jgi:hypothetical protein
LDLFNGFVLKILCELFYVTVERVESRSKRWSCCEFVSSDGGKSFLQTREKKVCIEGLERWTLFFHNLKWGLYRNFLWIVTSESGKNGVKKVCNCWRGEERRMLRKVLQGQFEVNWVWFTLNKGVTLQFRE